MWIEPQISYSTIKNFTSCTIGKNIFFGLLGIFFMFICVFYRIKHKRIFHWNNPSINSRYIQMHRNCLKLIDQVALPCMCDTCILSLKPFTLPGYKMNSWTLIFLQASLEESFPTYYMIIHKTIHVYYLNNSHNILIIKIKIQGLPTH